MSRSRPLQKNDNAWVEQRNWTHVRKIVGYRRFDTQTQLDLLNDVYADLALYKNFFQPTTNPSWECPSSACHPFLAEH